MTRIWIAALLAPLFCSQAMAADVTTLQAALEASRQNMESAKSRYEDAKATQSSQEKTVQHLKADLDKAQKQLEADRNQTGIAKKDYFEAKAKHDRAQAVLDKAWSNR